MSTVAAMAGPSTKSARTIRAVLTHPAAMAIKRLVRDLGWRIDRRRVVNPPLPTQVGSLLFVCLGNICRSPFAAARAYQLLDAAGVSGIRCASAGIDTRQGNRPPAEAVDAAEEFGLALDSHLPVQLTRELAEQFDLVVVMDADQRAVLCQQFPDLANRLFLLPLLDSGVIRGYEHFNIADPFGQSLEAFTHCYSRIDSAVTSLVQHIKWSCLPTPSPQGPADL